MQAEVKHQQGRGHSSQQMQAVAAPKSKKAVWKSLEAQEKQPTVHMQVTNPWNRTATAVVKPEQPLTQPQQQQKGFKDIMVSEALRRQTFERAATKSLASTQDEERAIVELEAFYNVSNVWDETITVERAGPKELATPIWNPKKIQRS